MLLFVVTKYFIDNEVTNCITGVNIDSFLSDTPGTALCVKTFTVLIMAYRGLDKVALCALHYYTSETLPY